MFLKIILLPLIGSLIVGFKGNTLGRNLSCIITTGCIMVSCIFSIKAFIEVGLNNNPNYIEIATWIESGSLYIPWGFMFDSLTVTMLVVVTLVSSLVHIYSIEYMKYDPHLPRFMSYISAFTFFMLVLITGDNFLQLFLGWEGVGLCSYLLINFWHTRAEANKAAIKAMLVNKVGDVGLLIGIAAIFYSTKSLDYSTVFASIHLLAEKKILFLNFEYDLLTIICFFLFVGCIGKSAQIGLHTWLPDAMEGPTPVSALIHAATMVTAGVFMLIRCSPLFEYSPHVLSIITVVGATTSFFAGTIALVQNDLKKVIAYSTCSQLGYMVFICGLSNYHVSIFHLANHAFFKALLFLGAGSIIHALNDEQDMRKMGGLNKLLPFTYVIMLIGSLALMGFPFLTGFYSKDVIIEVAYAKYTTTGHYAYWLGCLSAFLTSFYSMRLIYLTFFTKVNSNFTTIKNVHDAPILMAIPLIILGLASIFIGYLGKDMFIGLGTDFWNNAIYIKPENNIIIDSEFLPTFIKLIPLNCTIGASVLAIVLYKYYKKELINFSQKNITLYNFLSKKYHFDTIYNKLIVFKLLDIGYNITYKMIDKGLIEIYGPYGLSSFVNRFSKNIIRLQTGFVYSASFIMLIGLIVLLVLMPMNNIISFTISIFNIIIIIISILAYLFYI